MKNIQKAGNIVLSAVFSLAAAGLAAFFTDTGSQWFTSLALPAFQPPAIVCKIIWGVLYILFAVSFSFYTSEYGFADITVLLYFITGVMGPLWAYAFYSRHNVFGSVFLLAAMLYISIRLYKKTYEKHTVSAYLLWPYVLWIAFTLYLNYETSFLN